MSRTPALVMLALLAAGCVSATTTAPTASANEEADGTWASLAPLPVPRTEAAAVAAGGRVWVLGGLYDTGLPQSAGDTTRRVDVYDPATDAWSEGPALPQAVHHVGAVAVGTRIFVLGGFVGSPQFVPVADAWVLDTADAQPAWERFVDLPEPRGGGAAVTDGRRIWVFGGVGLPGPIYYVPTGLVTLLKSAHVLDLEAAQPRWERVADLPLPRDHLAGAFLDGKVYAVGGRDITLDKNVNRVDVYDPATDTWGRAANMPTRRGGIGAAVLDGKLHVMGGESIRGAFDLVEAYDPATDKWTRLGPMPDTRHGMGVAVLGDAAYVEGGGPTPGYSYTATNLRYSP